MTPAKKPITLEAPKIRFQNSQDNISKHREMVDSGEFQRGTDFALLQHAIVLGQNVNDDDTAKAAGYKLAGAVEYLATLRMLSEPPQRINLMPPSDNLDHRA
jgi:hypothetical protein